VKDNGKVADQHRLQGPGTLRIHNASPAAARVPTSAGCCPFAASMTAGRPITQSVGGRTITVKQHTGTRLATGGYQPTASKSTYSAVPRWSRLSCCGARPRPICTVGLEVCCDDALCFVGRCGCSFEKRRAEPGPADGEAAAEDCGLQGVRGSPEFCVDLYRICGYVLCGLTWLLMASM
jgi:hypothetical protein